MTARPSMPLGERGVRPKCGLPGRGAAGGLAQRGARGAVDDTATRGSLGRWSRRYPTFGPARARSPARWPGLNIAYEAVDRHVQAGGPRLRADGQNTTPVCDGARDLEEQQRVRPLFSAFGPQPIRDRLLMGDARRRYLLKATAVAELRHLELNAFWIPTISCPAAR